MNDYDKPLGATPQAKTYLCIGGPFHGQRHAVYNDARSMRVASWDKPYIGVERLDDYTKTGVRETVYNLKTIANRQSKDVTVDDTRSMVTIDTRTDVLVHESILTFEEAVAYHNKLVGPHTRQVAMSRALAQLKF